MEMSKLEKVIMAIEICIKSGCKDGIPNQLCPYSSEVGCDLNQILADALELLKEQERKKGSWDYGTQCSVCKGTIVPPWKRDTRVNFCPWCGADMRDSYEQKGR